MSKTVKQKAVHEIRLGKPKANGEANIIKPGVIFDCPADDLEWLQKQGACVDVAREVVAATPVDSEEEHRLALIEDAKALGVKGIRKDMTAEVVQAKIDQHRATEVKKAEDEGSADDDGEDDGNEDVL